MVTVHDARHRKLSQLVKDHGGLAALNRALDREARDATLGQILAGAPDSKTGAVRRMGDRLARQIEAKLGKPRGWMDTTDGSGDAPPGPPPDAADIAGMIVAASGEIARFAERIQHAPKHLAMSAGTLLFDYARTRDQCYLDAVDALLPRFPASVQQPSHDPKQSTG